MPHKYILLKQERDFQHTDYEKGALKLTLVPLSPCFHIEPIQICKIIRFMTAKHLGCHFDYLCLPNGEDVPASLA